MSDIFIFALSALSGYLAGSINPAILISKSLYKRDIRNVGSGNPGFTNFKRNFGKSAYLVMALDFGKTALALAIFGPLFARFGFPYRLGAAWTGLFAMLGHDFPIWHGFKGGKGVLVGVTTLLFINWKAGLLALLIWIIVLLLTHYMSLATLSGTLFGIASLMFFGIEKNVFLISVIFGTLIFIRHTENIRRLIKGEETKFSFKERP
mgnify:CR=1 FL=1